VDPRFDREVGRFPRRLEQRPDDDVEADVTEGRRDDPDATVVPVLAELGDEQPRRLAEPDREIL